MIKGRAALDYVGELETRLNVTGFPHRRGFGVGGRLGLERRIQKLSAQRSERSSTSLTGFLFPPSQPQSLRLN
jgi:hypothetical protein